MPRPGRPYTSVKKLALDALLTAIALTIFVVELQIPPVVPIPGVKLGLANIVTIFAFYLLGPADAAWVLLARILLGGLCSGRVMALLYSLSGGLLCYGAMFVMRKLVTEKQIWVCSIAGAIAHNIGQIAVAVLVTGTMGVLSYLPALMVSGICAGACTGLAGQLVVGRARFALAGRTNRCSDTVNSDKRGIPFS